MTEFQKTGPLGLIFIVAIGWGWEIERGKTAYCSHIDVHSSRLFLTTIPPVIAVTTGIESEYRKRQKKP